MFFYINSFINDNILFGKFFYFHTVYFYLFQKLQTVFLMFYHLL